jgi:hypothetical protein
VYVFFWALMMKLSPARRVLLLVAIGLFLFSGIHFHVDNNEVVDARFEWISALLLLLLLSLELADKVIMKRDLEIAREIQSWLVPSQAPEVPGGDIAFHTRPQNSVAGDYYDAFFPTATAAEGGRLMLVVADVAGKSVPAALLMATMQASLRTVAGDDAPLDKLVARLNRYASAYSLDGRRFTTAILGLYDPASGELTYVNAGHNQPVIRRTDLSMEFLDKGGLPHRIDRGVRNWHGNVARRRHSRDVHRWSRRGIQRWRRRIWKWALAQRDPRLAVRQRSPKPAVPHVPGRWFCRRDPPIGRHHLPRFPAQIRTRVVSVFESNAL